MSYYIIRIIHYTKKKGSIDAVSAKPVVPHLRLN